MRALLWFKRDHRVAMTTPALPGGLTAECLLPVCTGPCPCSSSIVFGMPHGRTRRAFLLEEPGGALEAELHQRGSHLLAGNRYTGQVIPQLVAQFSLDKVLTLAEIAPDEQAQVAHAAQQPALFPATIARQQPTAAKNLSPWIGCHQCLAKNRSLVEERFNVQPASRTRTDPGDLMARWH